MTAYGRGYAFERRVADDLESDGYWTIQSRGSHGVVDVAAVKCGETLLVQCKLGVMPGDEWNRLYELAVRLRAVPLVADRPERGVIRYRRITGVHKLGSRVWPAVEWLADRVVS